jgi:hypothetical protein
VGNHIHLRFQDKKKPTAPSCVIRSSDKISCTAPIATRMRSSLSFFCDSSLSSSWVKPRLAVLPFERNRAIRRRRLSFDNDLDHITRHGLADSSSLREDRRSDRSSDRGVRWPTLLLGKGNTSPVKRARRCSKFSLFYPFASERPYQATASVRCASQVNLF